MVFLVHYGGGSHGGIFLKLLNQVRLRGWTGVDLILVLSGFLITGILYDTQNDSEFFKRFCARRTMRILPGVLPRLRDHSSADACLSLPMAAATSLISRISRQLLRQL